MRVEVNGRHVTVESVGIATDEETGKWLAFFLLALATDRPGYTEENVSFTCNVGGELFDAVIRIVGAQNVGLRQYTFQGMFQGSAVKGSFETAGYTGSIYEAG